MLVNACEVQKQAVGCLVVKLAKKATSVLSGIRKDKFGSNKEDEMKKKVVLGREQLSQVWPQNNAVTHQLEDEVGVGLPVFRLHHRRL